MNGEQYGKRYENELVGLIILHILRKPNSIIVKYTGEFSAKGQSESVLFSSIPDPRVLRRAQIYMCTCVPIFESGLHEVASSGS